MKKKLLSLASLLGLLALAFAPAALISQEPAGGHAKDLAITAFSTPTTAKLTVTSPAFKDHENIPYENTQYRGNIFPGLSWTKGPTGTRSYVVIVQGTALNGQGRGTSIHLTLFNISSAVTTLKPGLTDPPAGSTYGPNVHGLNTPYAGPHTHTAAPNAYHYQVLALDTVLDLPPASTYDAIATAITGHVLATGDLVGVSARDPEAPPDASLRTQPTRIESGLISGVPGRDPSVRVYKGIPYAAPPVGDLRFRAPKPPIAWDGVRAADHFGASCPGEGPRDNVSEDCLFANVWTAAGSPTDDHPVMVWFHGAGFSGSTVDFDGEALAKKGILVVTFNRREGALGHLATPELSKESGHNASGNYSLLDSIAVLQWVHNNIAAFGGDPTRVTIVGESAGAGLVNFLSLSPLAHGLFLRAVAQSHVRYSQDPELRHLPENYVTLKEAEDAGLKYQESLGVRSLAELRALPWEKLTGGGGSTVLDGWAVPKGYRNTFNSRAQNSAAFLAGNDRDETGAVPEDSFAARRAAAANRPAGGPGGPGGPMAGAGGGGGIGSQGTNLTVDSFTAVIKRRFTTMSADFLKLYPAANDDQAAQSNNDTVRDNSRISTFLWASDWEAASAKPVYTYFWTWRHTGGNGGASHMSEIQFIFNSLDLVRPPSRGAYWTDDDRKVADMMSSYWANFVQTGNPNGPGLPNWPALTPNSPTVMELGEHFAPMPIATPEKLSLWKRYFATQPAM